MSEKILKNVKWHQLKKVIPDDQIVIDQMITKTINELVDAVNGLQEAFELIHPYLKYKNLNKVPDGPYAEQRKWIGKLCRFWNKTEYTDDLYGFLTDIVPTNKYKPEDNYFVPFKDEFGSFYEYCEPVKPDSDIIYKGE